VVRSPISPPANLGEPTQNPRSAAEVLELAKAAAESLLAELDCGAQATSNWADEELGFALVQTALDRCLSRLAETACWGHANRAPSNALWAVAGNLLIKGSLQARARTKPRGYAGDFEMFVQFDEWRCEGDALGKLFDRYFQNQAAVEAVRSRTRQIAGALTCHSLARGLESSGGPPYRVVSIGCGPALDIELAARWLPEPLRRRLSVTLLDLDGDAVEHAIGRLRSVLFDDQLAGFRDNLYRLADRPKSNALAENTDFLVCSGLFDYLPDAAAVKLLRWCWSRLNPRGMLLVGNFAPHNPSRAYMEWIGNWYLLYRAPADLARLAEQAGIPRWAIQIGAERLGIDLFLIAENNV
jgi:SAM-dependent methyltransferase